MTDNAGVVQTEYIYEAFGRATATGAFNGSSYQYTGRENDRTGLYYYRARYYHPQLQRFVSEDPVLNVGNSDFPYLLLYLLPDPKDLNPYVYVRNNPLLFIDPLGLLPPCSGTWKLISSEQIFPDAFCGCYWQCVECDGRPGPIGVTLGQTTGGGIGCYCGDVNRGGPRPPEPPSFRQGPLPPGIWRSR